MATRQELQARIEEVTRAQANSTSSWASNVDDYLRRRKAELTAELSESDEDIFSSVLRSHAAICEAKGMGEKDAYGQDPALYYSAAVSAEAGEQLNKIIRGLRNGNNPEASRAAVVSELPDVMIYSIVLAHVLDLDIAKLVADKVEVVIERALNGYYGGKLPEKG